MAAGGDPLPLAASRFLPDGLSLKINSKLSPGTGDPARVGAVIAAALALPGVAQAEGAPTDGLIGLKYLYYRESRDWIGTPLPGDDRTKPGLRVSSPSVYALLPLGSAWSVEGSVVVDSLSGATPRWHSAITSASQMSDDRTAADVRITRYFRRAAIGFGYAYSDENDYTSNAFSTDLRLATDDNNTTLTIGTGYADDKIKVNSEHPGSQGQLPTDIFGNPVAQKKRTNDFLIGITQVVSAADIVQANFTHARGRGYFTDPYKFFDNRPDERNQTAMLLRWNHHFSGVGGTLRSSYRYYSDTYDVIGHTFGVEWAQPFSTRLIVTPSLRYHSQSSARFYVDPIPGTQIPPFDSLYPPYYSADSRLSAFGAVTAGIKVSVPITKLWSVDAKVDLYQQRGDWRLFGSGSPGLGTFNAQFYQVGISRRL